MENPLIDLFDYSTLSVADLRRKVRERGLASGPPVLAARKSELCDLLSGRIAALGGNGHKGGNGEDPDLADVLARALRGRLESELDEERVIELIREHARIEKVVKRVELPDKPPVDIEDLTHSQFETVLRLVRLGLPVYLVGPAGTGKTTLAGQVATALGLPFSYNSMSAGCTESHLLGRTLPDENGKWVYRPSAFVHTYEHGGVHLFDEIDSADANLMTVINAAISNGHLSLPFENRVIARHPDCHIICAANTYGTGADRMYVGRNALDAATLDRFAMSTVEIDYDAEMEHALTDDILPDTPFAAELLQWVGNVRAAIRQNKLRRIMSTRSLVAAAVRIRAGQTLDEIKKAYFATWSQDEQARVV